jgi:putative methyltransferase (TIGR04325 family)
LAPVVSSPSPPLLYRSFAEASAACGDGYQAHDLVAFVRDRFQAALNSGVDFSTLPTMQLVATVQAASVAARGQTLRCLDIGGQFGAQKYFVAAATRSSSRWAVVETPAVVNASKDSDGLRFFHSAEPAADWLEVINLLNMSGVIQFLDDAPSVIEGLLRLSPEFISVTRTPFTQTDTAYDVQISRLYDNGFGPIPDHYADREVHYPRIIWNKKVIMDSLSDYCLVWSACEGPEYLLGNLAVTENHSMLFQRR